MTVRTQDPQQLIACLHRLMLNCSDEVMKRASNYADGLEAMPKSPEYIERAQLILERHNIKCPEAE